MVSNPVNFNVENVMEIWIRIKSGPVGKVREKPADDHVKPYASNGAVSHSGSEGKQELSGLDEQKKESDAGRGQTKRI